MPVLPRLLLTAFEPFGGRSKNASAEALARLEASWPYPDRLELRTRLLPVETERAAQMLIAAMGEVQPDVVLSLGEAKREALSIETTGYNERTFAIPDNAGNSFDGEPILPDAPEAHSSTLPNDAMLAAIEAAGVPACLSNDPGRYLCNEVLFCGLHCAAVTHPPTRLGFIHVPLLPEEASGDDVPSMPTETVVKGLLAALEVLLEAVRQPD